MKQAVIFGAGNIGRGFIGQTFSQSGYRVTFVDIFPAVVDALNQAGQYPVQIVSNTAMTTVLVGPVQALLASEIDRVAEAVAAADMMATAVGVNALPSVAPLLAAGFRRRWQNPDSRPLDILICENKLDADHYLRELVREQLSAADSALLDQRIGFVEASIGRMVPLMPAALKNEQPLLIQVEPYCELPVDAAGFRGPIPDLTGLKPFAPFAFYIKRKLYLHNLGHAVIAYLGWLRGHATIAEAILDPAIQPLVRQAMGESAAALAKGYQVPPDELEAHVEDLISRFANRRLGDTVFRVGRDPLRKLAADDRLAGGLRFVLEQDLQPLAIALGLAAGLLFCPADDPSSQEMQLRLQQEGAAQFLAVHSGLSGSAQLDDWRRLILLLNQALSLGGKSREVRTDEA
jgi:mannitol-1-phosphate 5-dehydrogenase